MIKKADIVLCIAMIAVGLFVSWYSLSASHAGNEVVITVDSKIFGIYSLSEDREIDVNRQGHSNHITIKDGKVSMTSSSCENQVCVHTGAISQTKDSIACLPNKVIIQICLDSSGNSKGGDVDVISGETKKYTRPP